MYGNRDASGGGTRPAGGSKPTAGVTARQDRRKITAPALRARKGGQPIAMVTAYDFTMARLLDRGGVDALLVGDSLGMVVQGRTSTIPVTLEEACYHTRAVARGAEYAHVVGDMPFMSYQTSVEDAVRNAGRIVSEGGAAFVNCAAINASESKKRDRMLCPVRSFGMALHKSVLLCIEN
jgi:3-methyl-2-oxobutanoate hydroxymethyltransferase